MVLDYELGRERLVDFFKTYVSSGEDGEKHFVYSDQIRALARRDQTAFYVDLEDIERTDDELYQEIRSNSARYHKLAEEAVDKLIDEVRGTEQYPVKDAQDAYLYQRIYQQLRNQTNQADGSAPPADTRRGIPSKLVRRFELYFRTPDVDKCLAAREILADHVGKIVTMRGVVIRCSEVMPLASVITLLCDTCGSEVYQEINGPSYTPATICPSKDCAESRAKGRLEIQLRGSSFLKYQEVRIQEMSDQVPVGSIPRSITARVTGENTRMCQPGDTIKLTGIMMPVLRTGFKQQQGGGLVADTVLDCHCIENLRVDDEKSVTGELTEEEVQLVARDDIYNLLAYSIAPEIYGHIDVKKSLLLALVGGVDKNANGMKIRGAINMLLVGDPGMAKSQLLGYVDRLAVRSQYTTGRGSSGVGLTAAVVKDPITGEMILEGGALVLADRGICCIDEFDKMLDSDRTAIHEVMEQQTISISKAGINTSLNARVSIIAAANPAYGRYNNKKTVEENVQLPAALISRFDLLWLIQDLPDQENDKRIAEHITYVHMNGHEPASNFKPLSMPLIRRYIALCKQYNPVVPANLQQRLVDKYVELRQTARENLDTSVFTSPRNLLAVVRMATAHARLHLREVVTEADIDEALRILDACKASVISHDNTTRRNRDPVDAVFELIRSNVDRENHTISRTKLTREAELRGLSVDAIDKCLERYRQVLMTVDGDIVVTL